MQAVHPIRVYSCPLTLLSPVLGEGCASSSASSTAAPSATGQTMIDSRCCKGWKG